MNPNRSVPPEGKVPYYRSDGTGRDTYIREHNGGLLSKDRLHFLHLSKAPKERKFSFGMMKYNRHPTSYQYGASNKFPHYVSDGSGRDYYVKQTEGGNSQPFRWRNETDYKFKSSLRGHDPFPPYKNPEKEDVFMKTQMVPTSQQSMFRHTMSTYQSHLDRRLSEPKKMVKPPPLDTYFSNHPHKTRSSKSHHNQ